uniref:Ribosome associated membrane protein RAMP4 n=1 Tax=Siphoviridae sp. ctLqe90 TaxID=2825456 RepID=A0A8S5Q3P6_9CAUD|nr:MAG TPA: Ribosome associated membrane protein RAMP4 [Siphoviridae sp. ctLqe90]
MIFVVCGGCVTNIIAIFSPITIISAFANSIYINKLFIRYIITAVFVIAYFST